LSSPRWHEKAACASPSVPLEIFYSEAGGHRGDAATELSSHGRAMRVCARCPVRRPCLAQAIADEASGLNYGVWGGIPPEKRREARKEQRPLDETLDSLEAWFREQAPRWLTDDEEVVT
jgi:WhiB family redox-sensing transcriptional regulator